MAWCIAATVTWMSSRDGALRPLVAAFYGCFLLMLAWHAPRSAVQTLVQFEPPPPARVLDDGHWWRQGLQETRHFDLQARGDLQLLERRLREQGWTAQAPADWIAVLGLLDVRTRFHPDKSLAPAEGRNESLPGGLRPLSDLPVRGYEIHMGQTTVGPDADPLDLCFWLQNRYGSTQGALRAELTLHWHRPGEG